MQSRYIRAEAVPSTTIACNITLLLLVRTRMRQVGKDTIGTKYPAGIKGIKDSSLIFAIAITAAFGACLEC
eukprot:1153933-Pelagomonas_calceolata.AAC.1